VVLHGGHVVRLEDALALLPDEVFVEGCRFAAEKVGCVLGIIVFEVVEKSGRHVCVVGARSHCGEKHTAGELVQPPGNEPAGENNAEEVGCKQSDALA